MEARGDSFAQSPGPTSGSQNNGGPAGTLHPFGHACVWCLMHGSRAA
jgi:hypothetical protein